MPRIEFRLTDEQLEMLDRVAEDIEAPLQPHHAAKAGHSWNRKEAFLHLLRQYHANETETERS